MKDLLAMLTKNTISVCFKSGDTIENAVIEGIMGNQMIVNHEGKITVIEIPHIGYISTEAGAMEAIASILSNQQSTQGENQNNNQNSSQNNNEKDSSKDNKNGKEKDSSRDNKKNKESLFRY